jgi:hypothetical protein
MSNQAPPPPPPPEGFGQQPSDPYGQPQGGYGQQPPAYGMPQYGGGAPQGSNQKALWALILGIVSIVCCLGLLAGIPAIILSRIADKEIAATGQGGAGMAKAGLILGIIGIILSLLWGIAIGVGGLSFNFSTS